MKWHGKCCLCSKLLTTSFIRANPDKRKVFCSAEHLRSWAEMLNPGPELIIKREDNLHRFLHCSE